MWKFRIASLAKTDPQAPKTGTCQDSAIPFCQPIISGPASHNSIVVHFPGSRTRKRSEVPQNTRLPDRVGNHEVRDTAAKRREKWKFSDGIHAEDLHFTRRKPSLSFPIILEKSGNPECTIYKENE